ncbi:YggS family pyridoxal phosphate-dependent enzyme [Thiohalobacter thiocyanaticus]|uniref:YggS family pyridoxal phosphate-dependent enzyme n=1 Tax=Thiohalobacter thiocyanaticus TaxID=585455 RepID=UPI0026B0ACE6
MTLPRDQQLCQRRQELLERISEWCDQYGRGRDCVRLLAVSKQFPADDIQTLAGCGQSAFGESYLKEALDKLDMLSGLNLEWHFIGPMQSNKTRRIAERFAWVQSLDRLKVAQRLAEQRPAELPPLNVCLQVNISGEASKSGTDPADLPGLAAAVTGLPQLRLRGLMAIPAPTIQFGEQRRAFARLRDLYDSLVTAGHDLDTLSMGMSNDLEAAIAEGGTLVRVGTALFGQRAAAPAAD